MENTENSGKGISDVNMSGKVSKFLKAFKEKQEKEKASGNVGNIVDTRKTDSEVNKRKGSIVMVTGGNNGDEKEGKVDKGGSDGEQENMEIGTEQEVDPLEGLGTQGIQGWKQ